MDIDHFKKINDEYGHATGDIVLEEIADLIRSNLRRNDVFSRFGGEEFILLLPETRHEDAFIIAENVRNRIEEHTFTSENKKILKVTMSIGVASYPLHALIGENLISRADQALYQAKDSGRNNVKSA